MTRSQSPSPRQTSGPGEGRIRPSRNRRRVHSNRSEARHANAPALAGWESCHRLRRFECSVRSRRLSRPVLLESNPDAPATRRRSFRVAFDADRIRVCGQAWRNPVENALNQTRGFTSWQFSIKLRRLEPNRSSKRNVAEAVPFGFNSTVLQEYLFGRRR